MHRRTNSSFSYSPCGDLSHTMEIPSLSGLAWGWTSSTNTLPYKIPHLLTFPSKSAPPVLVASPFPPKAIHQKQSWEYPLLKGKWANTELAGCPKLQTALGTCSDCHQLLPAMCPRRHGTLHAPLSSKVSLPWRAAWSPAGGPLGGEVQASVTWCLY